MMKRLICLALGVMCLLLLGGCTGGENGSRTGVLVMSDDQTVGTVYTSGDYMYILLADGTAVIMNYTGSAAELTIPSKLNGKLVTGIGNDAFRNGYFLTSVTLPEGVTSIGAKAFSGCSSLKSVTIPEGVTSIGADAFAACSATFTLTVSRDSYARQYAIDHGVDYAYPDANDWLTN